MHHFGLKEINDGAKHLEHKAGYESIHIFIKLKKSVYWMVLALAVGLIVGLYSSAFSLLLQRANALRGNHAETLFFLPVAGLIIVFLYRRCGIYKDRGTNEVLSSAGSGIKMHGAMAVLIFISTILTHLCGGSAGREGAALQMGGGLGDGISRVLKKSREEARIIIMCGMSAAFSAVFGTPMAAVLFSLEAASVGIIQYVALLPCIIASLAARQVASYFGIAPEAFAIAVIPDFSFYGCIMALLLGALSAAVGTIFVVMLHAGGRYYEKYFKNPYIRVFAGGVLIIMLTLLEGSGDYNGAGTNLIERAICDGEASGFAFFLKMLFTALTLGAGFKGGEIVPSFCVGALFGCVFGQLTGFSPSFCAAVGMAAVFCAVTNCPLTTIIISFELFGYVGLTYIMLAAAASYSLSGYSGLYSGQTIVYSKYGFKYINRLVGGKGAREDINGK